MTEDKTTITDNEVIGVFMGGKPSEHHMPKGTYIFFDQLYHGQQLHAYKKMKYSNSWEWLMPVWHKFRDLKMGNNEYHEWEHSDRMLRIADTIAYGSISEACKLLAEGIRWYNSTTQNKEQS